MEVVEDFERLRCCHFAMIVRESEIGYG
jgi:hypothetical protein